MTAGRDFTQGSFTGDRWTQLTLLVNIMTHTTFTQSNLSVYSEVLNPLISCMSLRVGESFATSASVKQKPVHCAAKIARKVDDKNADMDYHAVPAPKHQAGSDSKRETCVSQILKELTKRHQDHAPDNWKLQEHQAPGDQLQLKICQVERKFIFVQVLMETSTSESSTIPQRMPNRRTWRSTTFATKLVFLLPIFMMSRSTLRFGANLRESAYGLHLGLPRITKTSKRWRCIKVLQEWKI